MSKYTYKETNVGYIVYGPYGEAVCNVYYPHDGKGVPIVDQAESERIAKQRAEDICAGLEMVNTERLRSLKRSLNVIPAGMTLREYIQRNREAAGFPDDE